MPSSMSTCQPLPPKFKSDKRPFSALKWWFKNRKRWSVICGKGLTNAAQTGGRQGENELLTAQEVKLRSDSFILNFWAPQSGDKSGSWNVLAEYKISTELSLAYFLGLLGNSWHYVRNLFSKRSCLSINKYTQIVSKKAASLVEKVK